MSQYDLNIIVCVDPRQCLGLSSHGRNGEKLLQELRQAVQEANVKEQVQVTPCYCIFGCTYGPRIDAARGWSGEKVLYGAIEGLAEITRRGKVHFSQIPGDLSHLIADNLPQR